MSSVAKTFLLVSLATIATAPGCASAPQRPESAEAKPEAKPEEKKAEPTANASPVPVAQPSAAPSPIATFGPSPAPSPQPGTAVYGPTPPPQQPVAPVATLKPGDKETAPLFGDFKVTRTMLDNGLKILVVEEHSSPTFAYQTWVNVGSREEARGRTGLAHLFEHMMFKETKNHKEGEFDKITDRAGAEGTNAFTSNDYTAYVQELPAAKLELIADLEADRMVNLVVDQKAFKTETEVVQNERRMRTENNPDGLMYKEIMGLAFTKHSYGWPVIGYTEDLEAMNAPDAVTFYQSWYNPAHATIVVVGDVKTDDVISLIKKHYGGIGPQPAPAIEIPVEPEQKAPRRKTLRLPIQVEKLIVGFPIPPMADADQPALQLLETILGGGKSSRLHRALVETGIASEVETNAMAKMDPSLFLVSANMQVGKKGTSAEAVILRELARLTREPLGELELKRAKNIMNFGFYDEFGSDGSIARFLGANETVLGDFRKGLQLYEKVQALTADDVMAVAKKYFDPNKRNVVLGVQK